MATASTQPALLPAARAWAHYSSRTLVAGVASIDGTAVVGALFLGSLARAYWNPFGEDLQTYWTAYLAATHGPWIGALWMFWLWARGAYSKSILGNGAEEFRRVFVATMLTAGSVAMICYLAKYDLSRGLVAMTFLVGLPLVLIGRLTARGVLHRLRRRGWGHRQVMVIGDPCEMENIVRTFRAGLHMGYTVVGSVPAPASRSTSDNGGSIISEWAAGTHEVLREALAIRADTVLVTGGAFTNSQDMRRLAWELEGTGVQLVLVPSLSDIAGERVRMETVAGLPLIHVKPPRASAATRWGKRTFDVACSIVLIVTLAPLWLAVIVAIKLADGGPVFFAQQRVGLNGKTFNCYKFRSMTVDAESGRAALAHLNESDGPLFKIRHDPRITGMGRILRRYSLDELPQLLNVLSGSMSLVGPRPPLPAEVRQYLEPVERRMLVRPGMTGLWQVSGRSTLTWEDAVRLDLYYVDNWSLVQDLMILTKTVRAVIAREGAY